MTTKEEKARLISMAGTLKVIAEELLLIGHGKKAKKEEPKKEKPEPKGGDVKGPMKIGDLNIGDEGITIEAEILEIETKTGKAKETKKDYKVTKLMLSDKSGPIKLVLWNEQTEHANNLEPHDIIRVEAWKVEKGYKGGVFELVYGQFGTINKINIERHII